MAPSDPRYVDASPERWALARILVYVIGGAAVILAVGWVVMGCGASEPRESDIFYDPALRASVVEPEDDADRTLLQRLAADPEPGPLTVGERTYVLEASYDAASGRRCRGLSVGSERRLACEADDAWAFVPSLETGP
ncbi:MAG: hypothetical protein AB7S26_35960 [Sandaracinaceae bacterium]